MKRIPTALSLMLAVVGLAMTACTPLAIAQESSGSHMDIKRTITVSGEGHVQAVPDKATVRFGIVSRADDPEEARRMNAETSRDAMRAVKALDIEDRKIRLETLRLQPFHTYNNQTRRNEEAGYEATRQLVVEIVDLDQLPSVISNLVEEGANRLQGITYGLQDRSAFRNEALTAAVKEARQKAELMATTLGAELGMVLHINEQGFAMPTPMVPMGGQPRLAMAKMEGDAELEAYAAGEMDVKATVQVVFALK